MSEETLLDTATSDAPQAAKKAAKKLATKKAAKKAAVKVAAKKATKKATKSAPEAVAPAVEAPAPIIVEAPPAPIFEAAPEIAFQPPASKVKRRPAKKKADEVPAAEKAPPVAKAAPVIIEPVAPPPAPEPAPSEPAAAEGEADTDGEAEGEGPEPTESTPGQRPSGGDRPMPPAIAAMGYTIASNGEWVHPSGRKLRWWERRKLERKARQAARAAGSPAAPHQQQQQPQHQGRGQPQHGQQGQGGGDGGGRHQGRHSHQQQQPAPAPAFEEQEPELEMPKVSDLGPPEPSHGLLEIGPKGHGFIRLKEKGWNALHTDSFVHGDIIRKFGLREGMMISGEQRKGSRGPQLTDVFTVNGRKPEDLRELPIFEELKAINPNKRYQLETRSDRYTMRVIDMLAPVGRGQRGLIVSPPRAGKTTILHHIAEAITQNYPQVHLMILLVDERPEEVTEFKRSLQNAELFASSNDQDAKSHGRIAQMAIERAKRLVEMGDHVFLLMDSITRLARAFNNMNKGGATMSGGMGVGSMEVPRRLFAAARNTRNAGSLTILATALVETGGKIDDLIFQEFKGTGNMELVLDRKIAEQFYWPAVNIFKSGTRREELLLQGFQLEKIHFLRRGLAGNKPLEAIQRVLQLLERYPNNAQMLVELASKEK